MNIPLRYRLIDLIRGTDSIDILSKLREWQYESTESLNLITKAKLDSYFKELQHAISMFRDITRFEDLPVTDKSYIKRYSKELRNPDYKGKIIQKKTGGSSGEPLIFYTGTLSQAYLWAGIYLSWEAAGYRFGDKVAFLVGPSLYKKGYDKSIFFFLLNVTLFSAFNMTSESMTRYGNALQKNNIRLIYGYASAIHHFARFYLDAGKVLTSNLRAIICTAETLTPAMRKDIESAFGVPCYNQYGVNDAGVSAFECEHRNGFHLITSRAYPEVMSDGRFISTDLCNRAMFIPRHDTGDIVRMSDRQCSCGRGFPMIEEVLGRKNDTVTDNRGVSVHNLFFLYLFHVELRIYSFQIIFNKNQLNINLHTQPMSEDEQMSIAKHFRSMISKKLVFQQIQIVFNAPFVEQANGKHKFVLEVT